MSDTTLTTGVLNRSSDDAESTSGFDLVVIDDATNESADHLTDPRYLKAKELRSVGLPVRKICRAVGISMTTYYQWFPKPSQEALQATNARLCEELRAMRKDGMSDAAIARHFKRNRQWVWAMIGPRDAPKPGSRVLVKWPTTIENRAKVERIARSLGAALDDRVVMIGTMLDMIANGELIVRAPARRAKPKPEAESSDRTFATSSRASR